MAFPTKDGNSSSALPTAQEFGTSSTVNQWLSKESLQLIPMKPNSEGH
jgi:hypothetical protein